MFSVSTSLFQSTSPVRGTTFDNPSRISITDISIHVPREGDDNVHEITNQAQSISIHVPREGDDS